MSQVDLPLSFVEDLVQRLLEDSDRVYYILNKDTPITEITLLGKSINVTLKRKPYVSAAGDILEKGKVIVNNMKKIETYLKGGELAELQSDESNVQDDKVGEGKKEQGEGEPTEEFIIQTQEEDGISSSEAIKKEELEIAEWWNKNKNNWAWSGCIVGTDWDEMFNDAKDEVRKIYNKLSIVPKHYKGENDD